MEFFKSDGARTGLFFGATSGVITTIGLIVGLNSGTRSITAVLGGILVIAVADAMSDALGIHLANDHDLPDQVRLLDKFCGAVTAVSADNGGRGVGRVGPARHRRPKLFSRQVPG